VLIGTALPDVLYGDAGDNTLQGGGGNDSLYSLTGQDLLDGGLGADAMAGGLGDDVYLVDNVGDVVTELSGEGRDRVETTLAAYGLTANVEDLTFVGTGNFTGIGNLLANVIIGGTGADTLRGGQGADTLNGGGASDTADYSTSAVAVNVNLATGAATGGDAAGDTLISMENVTGSAFNDVLTGDAGDNVLKGGDGNDTINGGAGADWLDGGSGVNALTGGSGDDTYVVQANGTGIITELAGDGIDTVRTSQSTATLEANVENLIFIGTGNFRGTGNDLANQITGGDGSDNIKGQGGNDILLGLAGADQLTGGDGNDRLDGGLGADILDDGSGNDTFVFHLGDGGQDTVRGFTAGAASNDVLEIHGTGWTTVADVLAHLGTGTNNNTTVIQLDATTSIMLKGVSALDLTNGDFLLM
jgi:serralysin